jgi:hypothetical protein
MAIDFMVMPLSRYISGDFITPVMRLCWEQGVPYTQVGPQGSREFPKDTPFGGAGASLRREQLMEMLYGDLNMLGQGIPSQLWNERSAVEISFHRVEPKSYEALLKEAAQRATRGSRHCTASLFLPCEFPDAFDMTTPFERLTGSSHRALWELEQGSAWPDETSLARETLLAALRDSLGSNLPMIVDW